LSISFYVFISVRRKEGILEGSLALEADLWGGQRSIELNRNFCDSLQHHTQGEVCHSFSGKSGEISFFKYMELIVCTLFLNSDIPHKKWALLLKYSIFRKLDFLSVHSYDW